MSEDLQDEITSINSIYGNDTLVPISGEPGVYAFVLPTLTSVTLRLSFPTEYPDAPPSVLGTYSVGEDVVKGFGTEVVDLARDILARTYIPGSPCVFDLIEESSQQLQQYQPNQATKPSAQISQACGQPGSDENLKTIPEHPWSDAASQPLNDLGDSPPWVVSEAISEKKSVFVARATGVESVEQAKRYLAHLLMTDKKVARATHNITAWRIRGENDVQFQDCDDDGETAAGGRVLHLLELMNVWNAMVVVTRWYGGVHLGSDRFRIINQVARDALVCGQFVPENGKENKRKPKK